MEDRTAHLASDAGAAGIPDASCLVEPAPGLWLLLLDANVYLPDGTGGFSDRSHEGWSAALRHKPWLLGWITEVARAAEREGKTLLAFSHYPMVDIFRGTLLQLDWLGAPRVGRRRMPTLEESLRLSDTGLRLHFSGHWHVDAAATDPSGRLRNMAVPSTVGFPAGYKVVEVEEGRIDVLDRTLEDVPGFDRWSPFQATELRRAGGERPAVPDARDYRTFLDAQFRDLVLQRRLPEDWPPRLSVLLDRSLGEVLGSLGGTHGAAVWALPLREVLVDWCRLRETGGGPRAAVAPDRRAASAALARSLPPPGLADGDQALVAVLIGTLARLMEGPRRTRPVPAGAAAC